MSRNPTTRVVQVKQRNVGRSGLRVSEVGVSTSSRDVVTRFLDAGGTLIDVSPSSADAISQVSRHEVVLSAQVGVRPERPAGQRVDCSRRSLLAQLDELLASLGTDHIDLLSVGHFDARTPVDEIANTLDYAVRSGRARYAGVRGYNAWQLAVTPGVIAAQREY